MNIKKVTSLTSMVSFLVLIVNSVVLYIVPKGRVAHWADWRVWGLNREEWSAQHIIIGLLFLIAIFLHIYYNWTLIVSYLKNKAKQFKLFTKEFNIALIITIVCTVGAYFPVPPFNYVLDLNEYFKETAKYGEPPYGHAEISTLKDFTRRVGFDLAESMQRLKKAGIRFESDKQTLLEIAKINQISSQQVYLAMKPLAEEAGKPKKMPDTPVQGMGKRSLTEICQTYGLDINTIFKGFVDHNIRAKADMNLKEIAAQNNMESKQVYNIIKEIAETQASPLQTKTPRTVEKAETPIKGVPSGLGRKTVAEVCKAYGIDQSEALKKLSAKGITANPGDKIKKLAEKYDKLPLDLYEIMK